MWPSGGLARVARPLAARCSALGDGRSDLGDFDRRRAAALMHRRARLPWCARPFGYVPRQTHECDAAVLVRWHLAEFLERCEERAGPLPAFGRAELEGFAGCGDYAESGIMRSPWAKLAVDVPMDHF